MVKPAALALLVILVGACNRAPDEPDPGAAPPPAAPPVAPLAWDAPGSWTKLPVPPSGPRKAAYKIEKAGNDKEDAELNVLFFGTGAKGDPATVFKEWFESFDGDPATTAKREEFEMKGFKVQTVEMAGTYKVALAPPVGPQKKTPVQMVKNNYRFLGAVVKTPDRGNWFFRVHGPDETVQAAKSSFRGMLESVK